MPGIPTKMLVIYAKYCIDFILRLLLSPKDSSEIWTIPSGLIREPRTCQTAIIVVLVVRHYVTPASISPFVNGIEFAIIQCGVPLSSILFIREG